MSKPPVLGDDGQPLDCIELRGLRATANHGALASERENPQEFRADVALYLDVQPAAEHDALAATVNYAAVAQAVGHVLTAPPVNLIETLAEQVAAAVLAFPSVRAVDVVLHKPSAPLPVPTDDVTVSIRRDVEHKKPVAHVRKPASELFAVVAESAEPVPEEPVEVFEEVLTEVEPEPEPEVEPEFELPVALEPVLAPILAAPPLVVAEVTPDDGVIYDDRLNRTPEKPVAAILGLGSNLGDSIETLQGAVVALSRTSGIKVAEVGPLARTSAVGGPAGQDDYYNSVVAIETTLSPRDLLAATQQIESDFNRVRDQHWGPRTLDIDIVAYGDLVASSDDLTVPHKLAHDRAFVLLPWSQMQPGAVLPGPGGGPVGPLAATAPDRAGVRWLRLDWLEPSEPATELEPGDAEVAPVDVAPVDAALEAPAFADSEWPEPAELEVEESQWDYSEPEQPVLPAQPAQPEQPEAVVEEYRTLVDFTPPIPAGPIPAGPIPAAPAPYPHNDPSAGLWTLGQEDQSAALQHPWAPSVPENPGPEYPTFTGILQGAPQHNGAPQQYSAAPQHGALQHHVYPGSQQLQQPGQGVPSHSLPTFTGDIRAGSPLAARAERVPLLKADDLEVPEVEYQRHDPPTPVPPFSRPVTTQHAPVPAPKPEVEAPSWDQILRGN